MAQHWLGQSMDFMRVMSTDLQSRIPFLLHRLDLHNLVLRDLATREQPYSANIAGGLGARTYTLHTPRTQ